MKSGIPLQRPAFSVNRLCGSGFQSIVSGAQVGSGYVTFKKYYLICKNRTHTISLYYDKEKFIYNSENI